MAKYANKETREDGSEVWLATDGREYKTKVGAYKHSKKLESEGSAIPPSDEAKTEGDTFHGQAPPSEPEWVEMEYDEELPSEVVPAALKRIKPRGGSGKPTKKQLEAERDLNEGILVVGYRTDGGYQSAVTEK